MTVSNKNKPPVSDLPHFWSGAEDVRIATIERCAQVAEETAHGKWFEIAAAIRALKDKP